LHNALDEFIYLDGPSPSTIIIAENACLCLHKATRYVHLSGSNAKVDDILERLNLMMDMALALEADSAIGEWPTTQGRNRVNPEIMSRLEAFFSQ
jgi:hypothetical protein